MNHIIFIRVFLIFAPMPCIPYNQGKNASIISKISLFTQNSLNFDGIRISSKTLSQFILDPTSFNLKERAHVSDLVGTTISKLCMAIHTERSTPISQELKLCATYIFILTNTVMICQSKCWFEIRLNGKNWYHIPPFSPLAVQSFRNPLPPDYALHLQKGLECINKKVWWTYKKYVWIH